MAASRSVVAPVSTANAVATVGGRAVTVPQVAQRVQSVYRDAQRQQPGLTMPAFLAAIGGLGPIIEQYIGATVLSAWAEKHGITPNDEWRWLDAIAIKSKDIIRRQLRFDDHFHKHYVPNFDG